jgi:hypothetical protein
MGVLKMLPLVSTVEVQLWVLAAALGAALLASLAYVLMHTLGLVKPLPPEEETHH